MHAAALGGSKFLVFFGHRFACVDRALRPMRAGRPREQQCATGIEQMLTMCRINSTLTPPCSVNPEVQKLVADGYFLIAVRDREPACNWRLASTAVQFPVHLA